MAAYAALVSLTHLVEQIEHHPDPPPLSLDRKQAESLTEKVGFLRGLLEDFHCRGFSQEIQDLESRILDVARAAEDVIESQILLVSEVRRRRWIPAHRISNLSTEFYEGLQRVNKAVKVIEKQAVTMMDAKTKKPRVEGDDHLPPRRSLLPPLEKATTMVGFDDILIEILDRLTRNQSRKLDIIPIVGMGGAGKTTLARNIYENKLIVEYFHTRSWATLSQECVVREVLIDFLLCQSNHKSGEDLSRKREQDLGEQLYRSLFGRRYLIVMDDVWSSEAWDKLKFFFPDKTCPLELEEIGRKIARNCRGLPLSIVTIGGLLAKSDMTRDYWEYVAENLSSLVNSEDDERCLRILSLSYIHLPVYLKPCFLYMGLFPEDEVIRASYLIKLWVAEGFLKPISGKALEVVGEDYLNDLVDRNLVLVKVWGSDLEIQLCAVHDLLRDLCLREAQKERFFSVTRMDNLDNLQGNGISSNTQRRIAIHHGTPYSVLFMRSRTLNSEEGLKSISFRSVRFLRVLADVKSNADYGLDDTTTPLVNSRLLYPNINKCISSLWSMSWSLQTLIVDGYLTDLVTLDIWKMPQLRHVKMDTILLAEPPHVDGGRLQVLENLQTLVKVEAFKCSDDVVKRIPKVKTLTISYDVEDTTSLTDYCLFNLGRLRNLEFLVIEFYPMEICSNWLDGLTLPCSLTKLSLYNVKLDSDVMSTTIGGSLPLLEVLKLRIIAFVGDEWNPVEGQFPRLQFLEIACTNLKYWNNADNTRFPCLVRLVLADTSSLEEFPSDIGDIPTLVFIYLVKVSDSLIISAKRMLEEQEEQLGNVGELSIFVALDEE